MEAEKSNYITVFTVEKHEKNSTKINYRYFRNHVPSPDHGQTNFGTASFVHQVRIIIELGISVFRFPMRDKTTSTHSIIFIIQQLQE